MKDTSGEKKIPKRVSIQNLFNDDEYTSKPEKKTHPKSLTKSPVKTPLAFSSEVSSQNTSTRSEKEVKLIEEAMVPPLKNRKEEEISKGT